MSYQVILYYHGKPSETHAFDSLDEALAFYENKKTACRLGLVGWSVGYPVEVKTP